MQSRMLRSVGHALALAAMALVPLSAAAKSGKKSTSTDSPSRWDIFAGYSYLAPIAKIPGTVPHAPGSTYGQINWGAIGSVARYFNNHVGVEIEGDEHMQSEDWPVGDNNASFNSNDDFAGIGAGLIYRMPMGRFTPFFHVLGGAERVGSVYQNEIWGPTFTGGAGLDINTPLFNHHLGIRFGQVDYQYTYANYGVTDSNINSYRISTGMLWHLGTIAPPPAVTIACSASPESVYPGEPVNVTATTTNLDPKQNAVYSWSGEGVSGNGTTAKVDTSSLAPGTYKVQCGVKEGKKGKEGLKPWQNAESSASFTVKQFEPPTVSCSANPSTIKPGESSTITAQGVSPQNRPLTYSYTASAGTVEGSGTTATFNSAGAPTGVVGITCKVSDDKGQTATSQTNVTVEAPPPPPQPHAQALCSISFTNDKRRPMRVDNEAKACLDQVALDLKQQPDAKAVVVGEETSAEKATTAKQEARAAKRHHVKVDQFAAQRAVNTKEYLVTDQGIDASRISVMTGNTDGQTVENYLVPAGANFASDVQGTTPVDETAVKPQARKPLAERHHHRKAAK